MKIVLLTFLITVAAVPILGAVLPSIEITDPSNPVQFKTTGVDPSKYGVTAIINVFGTYWTKPYWATPIMAINTDGTGSINTVTGGQDACAQTVYLFVVPLNSTFTLGTGQAAIPGDLIALALCSTSSQRSASGKTLTVFGLDWDMKDTGPCVWGPGPNAFSANNAWVDAEGRLHLRISFTNGVWQCAEIISKKSLGFGTYSFNIDSDLSTLPGPVVTSVFVYSDNADFNHREVDFIEFSNGDVVGLPNPYQVVVQPYSIPGHRNQFSLAQSPSYSFRATWLQGMVSFAAYPKPPTVSGLSLSHILQSRTAVPFMDVAFPPIIDETTLKLASQNSVTVPYFAWGPTTQVFRTKLSSFGEITDVATVAQATMADGIPPAGDERVHMNTWLFSGAEPGPQTNSYEVVVSSFQFQPADMSKLMPRLEMLRPSLPAINGNPIQINVSQP